MNTTKSVDASSSSSIIIPGSTSRSTPDETSTTPIEDSADNWPDPLPLDQFDLPDFPVDALPGWLGDHIDSLSGHLQVPSGTAAMVGLGVLSCSVTGAFSVSIEEEWTEPLNLWLVPLLPSGHRKSPVYSQLIEPLEQAEKALPGTPFGVNNTLLVEVESDGKDFYPGVSDRQLFVDKVTPQGLADMLDDQYERIGVFSDEGGPLKRLTHGGLKGTDLFKKAWDGGTWRDNIRTKDSIILHNPLITMVLTIQPEIFEDVADDKVLKHEGFLGRFLFHYPEASYVGYRKVGDERPPLDPDAKDHYQNLMLDLLEHRHRRTGDLSRPTTHEVPFTDRARERFQEFEAWVEGNLRPHGRLAELEEWAQKLPGKVARIAGLLAIGDRIDWNPGSFPQNLTVTPRHVERAVRIGKALVPHARRALQEVDPNSNYQMALYILDRLSQFGDVERETLTVRDLFEATKGNANIETVEDLTDVLAYLEEHHVLRVKERPSEGRGRNPSPTVEVNPKSRI